MVESLAHALGLGFVRLHGGIPTHKRGDLMDKFQNDDAIQVFISTDAGGVGLNLQAGSALINLDMPWNPAVLDQRIARIHRLGQKQKVQIFILLAENSYEQQVASLVKGKRDLFDNVISPDATEDVVGVSKKMLQSIIDDLAEPAAPELATTETKQPEELALAAKTQDQVIDSTFSTEQDEDNSATHALITQVQSSFNQRIERILASGGGLLIVVNPAGPDDDNLANELSTTEIPVVVIEAKILSNLQRLGAASPVADAHVVYEPEVTQQETINPLIKIAQDKLRSAEVLVEQQCYAGVMEILAATCLTVAAIASGQQQVPNVDKATVWLYSDVLPQQLLSAEQIATIVKIIALSQNIDVPDALVQQSLLDTQILLAQYA